MVMVGVGGTFAKARIRWKISQSLKRRVRVRLGREAEPIWVDLKYARLPNLCFIYGLLGHSVKECYSEVDEGWRRPEGYQFGN